MSGGYAKTGNGLFSFQLPRDWSHSGHSHGFPSLLVFLCYAVYLSMRVEIMLFALLTRLPAWHFGRLYGEKSYSRLWHSSGYACSLGGAKCVTVITAIRASK
ncbi:hypothetical protein TNCV_3395841 [Trichonephila clavipes]|nr:hypothetical protein TNCV_3395841 [Trichonephila clavipes]